MNKIDFQQHLPFFIKRLFTWGLGCAVLFLFAWYQGGINLWGNVLELFFWPFGFLANIRFSSGSSKTAAFLYEISVGQKTVDVNVVANGLNSTFVTVVTLLGMWKHGSLRSFFRLAGFCFLFLTAYHMFHVLVHGYNFRIGEACANRFELFWEPSLWIDFVGHVAAFDKFVLRFWGGFPIFFAGLGCFLWWDRKRQAT